MKNKSLKNAILLSAITLTSVYGLTGCGEVEQKNDSEHLYEFENIAFEDKVVEYDGNFHTISPLNLPDDTSIKYIGQSSFKEIGTHTIRVEISKKFYKNLTLEAKLRITKPTIKGISMPDYISVQYNGRDQSKDIKPSGEGLDACKVYGPTIIKDNEEVEEAIEVGLYTVRYRITKDGFEDLFLKTDLRILGKDFSLVTLNTLNSEVYVPYDGLDHSNDIGVNKPLNPNATVKKVICDSKLRVVNEVVEVGDYLFTFTVSEPNYNDAILVAGMHVFDGEHIVNRKNNIETYELKNADNSYSSYLMFLDLHNDGKLTSYDGKTNEFKEIIPSYIQDYAVAENFIFIKDEENKIKYGNLYDPELVLKDFADQKANLDFVSVQHRTLIYTRPGELENTTEICRLTSEFLPEVIYTGTNIYNLKAETNNLYFIDQKDLFTKQLYQLPIAEDMTGKTANVVDPSINNVNKFVISGNRIYFSTIGLTNTVYYYPLYGSDKTVTQLVSVEGLNFEFVINGDELIYMTTGILNRNGIYKHFIDKDVEDTILFNNSSLKLSLNSLTVYNEELYFSNQFTNDCHLYKIKTFGETKKPTLVK